MKTQTIHRFPWASGERAQVWIVHFGSKSTPLIAQLCREIGLESRVVKWEDLLNTWHTRKSTPKLMILSGGEQSVYDANAPTINPDLFDVITGHCATLGICYGAQLMVQLAGGEVRRAEHAEFGEVNVVCREFGLYQGGMAIMNHRDEITRLPDGWQKVASTLRCENALVGIGTQWAVQFHPEMDHTEEGEYILRHIAFKIAKCKADYSFDVLRFTASVRTWFREICPDKRLICGLSGGVDSAVTMALARGTDRPTPVHGIYVNTGWMRDGETEEIHAVFGDEGVTYVDASDAFHACIEAVPYPAEGHPAECEGSYYELIRKAMGACFIDVFVSEARRLFSGATQNEDRAVHENAFALLQGTNASDIIESETGLKSHHNVGGLPDQLNVEIVEPLAGLYKFEIRLLAEALGLPKEIVFRQPFPGPGLALRTWGKLSRDLAPPLRAANRILEEVLRSHYPDIHTRPCQYYAGLAPLPSTGLMGDARVIGYAWWIRMVTSRRRESYSTLGVFEPTWAFMQELSHRLTSETRMLDGTPFVRVGYEVTGKPPSTVEPH